MCGCFEKSAPSVPTRCPYFLDSCNFLQVWQVSRTFDRVCLVPSIGICWLRRREFLFREWCRPRLLHRSWEDDLKTKHPSIHGSSKIDLYRLCLSCFVCVGGGWECTELYIENQLDPWLEVWWFKDAVLDRVTGLDEHTPVYGMCPLTRVAFGLMRV